jgi:homogentisate 1,2-dioxygenase
MYRTKKFFVLVQNEKQNKAGKPDTQHATKKQFAVAAFNKIEAHEQAIASRAPIRVTKWASESPQMQLDYDDVWSGFAKGQVK